MREKIGTICVMVMVAFLTGSQAMATVEFNDGEIHDIDYVIGDDILVDANSPGVGTTVNLLPDGECDFVYTYEDSVFNLCGGYVTWGWVNAYGNSQVTVSSGLLAGAVHADDSSDIIVTGGDMGWWYGGIWTWGDEVTVSISDGNVYQGLHLWSNSQVTISGGSIDGGATWAGEEADWGSLNAKKSSQVTISGGLINDAIYDANEAIVTIVGSGFAVDGNAVGYGEITTILGGPPEDETARRLTGTLASGDPIDTDFYIGDTAKIVLVPEPATMGLLVMGGMAVLLRRKKVVAAHCGP